MHPEEELDVCPEGVEMAILLLVKILLTLVLVLPALFWTFIVCLFSDTLSYMRGYYTPSKAWRSPLRTPTSPRLHKNS